MSDQKRSCCDTWENGNHAFGCWDDKDQDKAHVVRLYRLNMLMTQDDLGTKIGRSGRMIRRYESGATPVPKLVYDAVKKLFDDKCKGSTNEN